MEAKVLTLKETCDSLSMQIQSIAEATKQMMSHPDVKAIDLSHPHVNLFEEHMKQKEKLGEMKANIMLAFRHLEDAKMRIEKVKALTNADPQPQTTDSHIEYAGQAIVVNGREIPFVTNQSLSFDQVVKLAFPKVRQEHIKDCTITYSHGTAIDNAGIMTPEREVAVQDGMIFNATLTNRT